MINYKAGQELDDGLIGLLCKKAFSLFPERIEKSEQAHTNTVYVITLSGGKKVVLKVGPYTNVRLMHHEKNMMYTEVTVLQKMKNYTSIEVPEMYYYDASNTEFNGEYFFMEYLDGDNLADVRDALSKPAQASIDEELGRNNRALNDIIGSSFGYYGRLKKRKDKWMMPDITAYSYQEVTTRIFWGSFLNRIKNCLPRSKNPDLCIAICGTEMSL